MTATETMLDRLFVRLFNRTPSAVRICAIWLIAVSLITAAAVRTTSQYQTPGPFDENRLGFCDFHNGVYFPSKAWLNGDSPYSQRYADSYPVMRQIPLYSPLLFMVHAPIATLPLHLAEGAYFALMVACIIGSAWFMVAGLNQVPTTPRVSEAAATSKRRQLFLLGVFSTCLLFTRAAQTTLLSGYFTLELTLATLAIFYFDNKRSWIASIALAYSSIKPTFAIPLGILLLSMGRFQVVIRGTAIAIVLGTLGVLWLAANVPTQAGIESSFTDNVGVVIDGMLNSQEVHRNQNWSRPSISWTRIDLLSLIAKWARIDPDDNTHLIVMLIILAPVSWLLWRNKDSESSKGLLGLSSSVAIISLSVSMYKHVYDSIPFLAVALGSLFANANGWNIVPRNRRYLIAALTLIPLYNYSSTRMVLSRLPDSQLLYDLLTSVNAVVTIGVWLILLIQIFKAVPYHRRQPSHLL